MVNSDQSIICNDFESKLEKKSFRTTATLPLQWVLLTLLLQGAGAWSVCTEAEYEVRQKGET